MENTQEPTVAVILDRFERDYVPSLSPRTQIDYKRHIQFLNQWFGDRIAAELKPKDFGPFLDVKKGKIQRNRSLAVLSCAFSEAVGRWYWLERNVLRDVKRHPSTPRSRYVTDAEYETVKSAAPLRLRLAMELALLTGQRQGDIIDMKWEQIQDIGIVVEQSKTGKKLAIEITPALEAVLDKCWNLPNRGEYVITRSMGGRFTSEGFRAMCGVTVSDEPR